MHEIKIVCDVCNAQKQETNHWFKVIEKPLMNRIEFYAPDAEASENFEHEDICGQECLHKRLSQWLESETAPSPKESVTA